MSTPAVIRIVAQNLADEARALSPGEGRHREIEVDEAGLRTWLDNFAALSALDAEEADARLYLSVAATRVEVRWFGGHLGSEIGGTFLPATVNEIIGQALSTPAAAEPVPVTGAQTTQPPMPTSRPSRRRANGPMLAGLLAIFAVIIWWNTRPEMPEGTELIDSAAERQAILDKAAGRYASDNERLRIDAAAGRLKATNETGEQTLSTTLRVGRRAGVPVLVTEAGVVLEVAANGELRLGAANYRRLPSGG